MNKNQEEYINELTLKMRKDDESDVSHGLILPSSKYAMRVMGNVAMELKKRYGVDILKLGEFKEILNEIMKGNDEPYNNWRDANKGIIDDTQQKLDSSNEYFDLPNEFIFDMAMREYKRMAYEASVLEDFMKRVKEKNVKVNNNHKQWVVDIMEKKRTSDDYYQKFKAKIGNPNFPNVTHLFDGLKRWEKEVNGKDWDEKSSSFIQPLELAELAPEEDVQSNKHSDARDALITNINFLTEEFARMEEGLTEDEIDKRWERIRKLLTPYLARIKDEDGIDAMEKEKGDIIALFNNRFFNDGKYGIRLGTGGRGAYIKNTKITLKKDRRDEDKNLATTEHENLDSFFTYDIKDIYDMIEGYVSREEKSRFHLSVKAKEQIEAIVRSEINHMDKTVDITHGISNTKICEMIEDYINSKRNPRITTPFRLSSASRKKIEDIMRVEVHDLSLKNNRSSRSIIGRINGLRGLF